MNQIHNAGTIRRAIFTTFLAAMLVVVAPAARAGWEEGAAAFDAKDYATAMKELHPLAVAKDPASQYVVGIMHLYGLGVTEDPEKAAFWLRGAARQGNTMANLLLGLLYYQGKGVAEDHEQAATLFITAADGGNGTAMYFAGEVYEDIPGRSREMRSNGRKSYFYYTLASENLPDDKDLAESAKGKAALLGQLMTTPTRKEIDRELAEWRKAHQ